MVKKFLNDNVGRTSANIHTSMIGGHFFLPTVFTIFCKSLCAWSITEFLPGMKMWMRKVNNEPTLGFCLEWISLHFNRVPVGQARINPRCWSGTSLCFGFAEVGLVCQSTGEHRDFETDSNSTLISWCCGQLCPRVVVNEKTSWIALNINLIISWIHVYETPSIAALILWSVLSVMLPLPSHFKRHSLTCKIGPIRGR